MKILSKIFCRFKIFLKKIRGKNRAVILDRDGTLNIDYGYVGELEKFKLFPDVIPSLKKLENAGFLLIVITNQSGVGRGFFSIENVEKIHNHLKNILLSNGICLAKIYTCPHAPEENCKCRKPKTLLFEKAIKEFSLIPEKCYSIGDKETDIIPAEKLKMKGILLGRHCKNLKEAVEIILKDGFK